jgi:hypothetical protein
MRPTFIHRPSRTDPGLQRTTAKLASCAIAGIDGTEPLFG